MINSDNENSKYKLEVKIPGLPPTLNKLNSMHHFARARLNKKWREATLWAIDSIPPTPLKKAKITITRHSSVEGDGDNYTGGSYKAIVDALRHLGILSDDRVSNIGNIQTLWVKEKPGRGFIELKIEEL